jgi:uncharacterized protein (UPF0264 family)
MPGLLVSVRSREEALAAWAGGADVIDVKEPDRGPLGRADAAVWRAVRASLPAGVPVSVALGELPDGGIPRQVDDYAGIAFRKLGLARAGPDWRRRWAGILATHAEGPPWVAVAYADWSRAEAPDPESVLGAARFFGCAGLLIDTWDKTRPSPLAPREPWVSLVREARGAGLLVALAGRLDRYAIDRLAGLEPDLFAVRGAACRGRDRRGAIDRQRVADLSRLVRSLSGHGAGAPGAISRTSRSAE